MADKNPVPDRAERDAFFPSEYSLGQYVPPKTDFDGATKGQISHGPRTILVVCTDERYLEVEGGKYFSTGNHPVEMLLPLMHLTEAGFEVEVATPSGLMAKLELWAFPAKDEAVQAAYEKLLPQLRHPKALTDVVKGLGPDSDYAAVFVPGGHGAMIGLRDNRAVADVLNWALEADRYVITLCHGPAALLAPKKADGTSAFAGYSVCSFPDALDKGANVDIGYVPGQMTWFLGEALQSAGLTVVNDDMTGAVHADRKLLTGDSPLAANALGTLAVEKMAGERGV